MGRRTLGHARFATIEEIVNPVRFVDSCDALDLMIRARTMLQDLPATQANLQFDSALREQVARHTAAFAKIASVDRETPEDVEATFETPPSNSQRLNLTDFRGSYYWKDGE